MVLSPNSLLVLSVVSLLNSFVELSDRQPACISFPARLLGIDSIYAVPCWRGLGPGPCERRWAGQCGRGELRL